MWDCHCSLYTMALAFLVPFHSPTHSPLHPLLHSLHSPLHSPLHSLLHSLTRAHVQGVSSNTVRVLGGGDGAKDGTKGSSLGMAQFLHQQQVSLGSTHWEIVQISETQEPGIMKVWCMVAGDLHCMRMVSGESLVSLAFCFVCVCVCAYACVCMCMCLCLCGCCSKGKCQYATPHARSWFLCKRAFTVTLLCIFRTFLDGFT